MKEKQKRARRICRRALNSLSAILFIGTFYIVGLLEQPQAETHFWGLGIAGLASAGLAFAAGMLAKRIK